MKSDIEIQKNVIEQLKWEPFLNASEIGVAVKNGIVTLSGHVDSFSKKVTAEKAAKKIAGVKAIAEDIQIGVSPAFKKTDTEIAELVVKALKWNTTIPENKVQIKVENGIVKLEGEVAWEFQRKSATKAIQNLIGVRAIVNLITIKSQAPPVDIENRISSAFHRSATIDASKISAELRGNTVILSGKVRSFAEKEDAEAAAWAAPGVVKVDSYLEIEIPEFAY